MDGLTIEVRWGDGRVDAINLSDWIAAGSALIALIAMPEIWKTAKVVDYGTAIGWGDSDDLVIDAFHLRMLAAAEQARAKSVQSEGTNSCQRDCSPGEIGSRPDRGRSRMSPSCAAQRLSIVASDATSWSESGPGTLAALRPLVSKTFEGSRRRELVSFSHHRPLALVQVPAPAANIGTALRNTDVCRSLSKKRSSRRG